MNNMHIISRSQHPHLKGTHQQTKQNKTRIQLTHTQNFVPSQQKSHYSTVSSPFYPQNQQKQLSVQHEKSSHSVLSKISNPLQTSILLLMKEQIDIATSIYQQKMGKVLKAQAQELKRLATIIAQGNRIIQRQSDFIKSIKNNEQMLMSSKVTKTYIPEDIRSTSKSPNKISLTQRKSSKKITSGKESQLSPFKGQTRPNFDIQTKIDRLKYAIDQIQTRLKVNSSQNKELLYKIYQFQQKITSQIWKKLENCQDLLKKFLSQGQKKVVQLQKVTDSLCIFKKDIQNRLALLSEQSKELRQVIYNISQRQYTYQSFKIVKLKEQLIKISEQVDGLIVNQKKEMSVSIFRKQQSHNLQGSQKGSHKQNRSLNYSQRINSKSNLINANQQLQRSQFSSLSHYAPKYVKNVEEDRVKRSQQWDQLQQNSGLSAQDEFYYDDFDTQSQVREERLRSLQNILKKQGFKLPVRIEVDETGYLKEHDTGMYILDEMDNGYELNQQELKELKQRGVVY